MIRSVQVLKDNPAALQLSNLEKTFLDAKRAYEEALRAYVRAEMIRTGLNTGGHSAYQFTVEFIDGTAVMQDKDD